MKRIFDLSCALALLLLVSPLMFLTALLVRVKLGTPVIFKQQRPGWHAKPFYIYKFRTMTDERDKNGRLLPDEMRLTSFGLFLRRFSLDELPQLLNVIKGDLSLVGPRPLLMEYLELYTPEQARRHEVRPGITGWAQVNGRNALTWEEKFDLDLWYVKNRSLWLDLKILLITIRKVVKKEGISANNHVTAPMFKGGQSGMERSRKRIYLSVPHMGEFERQFVEEAFASNWLAPLGPHVDAFERELAESVGAAGGVALSSGTAAIHLALRLAGVGPGDTVFCSTLTFIGSANPILYLGAEPVFIDSEPQSWNLSPSALHRALLDAQKTGKMPKAVVVVNLYGQSADMSQLMEICDHFGVLIIEDAAESLGATYKDKASGTFGKFGIYSFNGNKVITASGGGMLISDDLELLNKARFWATQARDPALHYQHSEMGYNYRLSNVLAGIGRGQLRVLNDRIHSRRQVFDRYFSALSEIDGLTFMPEAPYGRSTRWLTALTVDSSRCGVTPSQIIEALARENIEARPVWKPLHLQPLFKDCAYYPYSSHESISDSLFENGLCLPSSSSLSEDDQYFVIECMKRCIG